MSARETVGKHMTIALRCHAYAALGPRVGAVVTITEIDCASWEGASYGHAFRAAEIAHDSAAQAAGARR